MTGDKISLSSPGWNEKLICLLIPSLGLVSTPEGLVDCSLIEGSWISETEEISGNGFSLSEIIPRPL